MAKKKKGAGQKASPWEWYAAKTVYRTIGRWHGSEAYPDPVSTVEERVVLIRARSWQEAEDKAFKEAKAYAKRGEKNDGSLRWRGKRVVDACAVHVLVGEPTAGHEVFWSSTYYKRKVPISEIIEKKLDGCRQNLTFRPEWCTPRLSDRGHR